MVLFKNCVRRPRPPTKLAAVTKNRKFGKKSLENYLLWNYWAKLGPNYGGMVIFQKCVRRPRLPTKMTTITKNRKFSLKSLKNYLLWNCWANCYWIRPVEGLIFNVLFHTCFFKIIEQWGGHAVEGKETLIYLLAFWNSPRFSLTSPLY